MAKHFGMRFKEYGDSYAIEAITWDVRQQEPSKKYIIHPDSLPLLEPMASDLIVDLTMPWFGAQYVYSDDDADGVRGRESLSNILRVVREHPGTLAMTMAIIQRDGKPFHWPKEGQP